MIGTAATKMVILRIYMLKKLFLEEIILKQDLFTEPVCYLCQSMITLDYSYAVI